MTAERGTGTGDLCGTARRRRAGTVAVIIAILGAFGATAVFAATAPQLRRYPYLTDALGTSVTLNWATAGPAATATASWGPAGSSCDARQVTATATGITVAGVAESQWKVTLTDLSPGAAYCYRIRLGATDLLAGDASPQFTAPPAPGASYSFAVFGDSGRVDAAGNNPDQANLMGQIAASGADLSLFAGDIPYVPTGTGQTTESTYGDLFYSRSAVFAPRFWTVPGRSIPIFLAPGNHGLSSSFIGNWPEAAAVAASGGRYQMDTYSGADGTTPASYPSAWYALNVGNARIYVLDTAWASSNIGTARSAYQADYDYHWNTAKTGCRPAPCGLEYEWLRSDLASHPSQLKFAVFHFPLYSDSNTEPSDSYLRSSGPAGANSLESLLSSNGVDIVFNGHSHLYERNFERNGIVSYVTGGGGAEPEPVDSCSPFDAYAIGWSSSGGSSCNAPEPTSVAQVTHFLLVSVSGTTVTVTPTDSLGRTFDVQTYDFGGAALPSPPPAPGPPPPAPAPVPVPFSTGASSIVLPSPPGTPVPIDVAHEIGGATLAAGACPALFSGTDAADRIDGTGAGDRIFGLGGDDVLNGLGGGDCLFGGPGSDRVFGGAGGDVASGGLGADRVEGGSDNDKLYGNGGSDRLYGQLGADRLSGGAGGDRLSGGAGNDLLLGGAGRDLLQGGLGRDVLKAGPGGRDVLAGGAGNDTLDARNHRRDSVDCGPGRDSARVDRADRVRGCERITPPRR